MLLTDKVNAEAYGFLIEHNHRDCTWENSERHFYISTRDILSAKFNSIMAYVNYNTNLILFIQILSTTN